MTYEKTPIKKTEVTADAVLGHYGTPTMAWHLVRRHRFALMTTWAVIVTLVLLFPPLADVI